MTSTTRSDPFTSTASSRSVIDLDRYPIATDGSARHDLVAACRAALADDGCVVLDDFVPPATLASVAAECRAVSDQAHFNRIVTNCYSNDDDPGLPPEHPQRVFMERTNGFVASDLIADRDLAVRRLYHDDALRRFVADCTGADALHEYGDPLAHLVVNVLRPGCQHPWHFDNNDFIVTLLTQPAEEGGVFEYCPGIRRTDDENVAAVGSVLAGDLGPVRALGLRPGSLQIFFGRNSLHRVTRVAGQQERHVLILGYAAEPGQIADADRTRRLFGRVTDAHLAAAASGSSLASVGTGPAHEPDQDGRAS